jgi:hypothetical protein
MTTPHSPSQSPVRKPGGSSLPPSPSSLQHPQPIQLPPILSIAQKPSAVNVAALSEEERMELLQQLTATQATPSSTPKPQGHEPINVDDDDNDEVEGSEQHVDEYQYPDIGTDMCADLPDEKELKPNDIPVCSFCINVKCVTAFGICVNAFTICVNAFVIRVNAFILCVNALFFFFLQRLLRLTQRTLLGQQWGSSHGATSLSALVLCAGTKTNRKKHQNLSRYLLVFLLILILFQGRFTVEEHGHSPLP